MPRQRERCPQPGPCFDESPGLAEVDLAGGASSQGQYDGETCSNTYCHGDGRTGGSVSRTAGGLACDGCHPGPQSGEAAFGAMSGEHRKHMQENMSCLDCHGSVTAGGESIVAPLLHIDGQIAIEFSESGIAWDPGAQRCSGPCHSDNHENDTW